MEVSLNELLRRLAEGHAPVTVGSGEHELRGAVVAFDADHRVIVYREDGEGGVTHYIPLTSVRSLGVEETPEGPSCFIELFKK